VVSVEERLRRCCVSWIERELPSPLGLTKRLLKIGLETGTDALHEVLLGLEASSPAEREAGVIRYYGADIFYDHREN
jgi:hypothetical protein